MNIGDAVDDKSSCINCINYGLLMDFESLIRDLNEKLILIKDRKQLEVYHI